MRALAAPAVRIGAVLLMITAVFGCSPGVFVCHQDAACGEGRCEQSGYCSFPSTACPSGFMYGEHAGDGLGGMCVADSESSGATEPGSESSSEPTPPGSDTADETGTTLPVDPDGSTTPDDSSEASTSAMDDLPPEKPSPLPACPGRLLTLETFETWPPAGPLWASYEDTEVVPKIVDGVLWFDVDVPAADGSGYAGANTPALSGPPFAGGMRVVAVPGVGLPINMYFDVTTDALQWSFSIEGGLLTTTHGPLAAATERLTVPFDPEEHAWLRIAFEDGTVTWEASGDGESWTTIDETTYESAQAELLAIHVGAGAYAGPTMLDDAMALDDAFACALETMDAPARAWRSRGRTGRSGADRAGRSARIERRPRPAA
jgi:hypothetical protein